MENNRRKSKSTKKNLKLGEGGFSEVYSSCDNFVDAHRTANNCKGGTCPTDPMNNCGKGVNCLLYCGIK